MRKLVCSTATLLALLFSLIAPVLALDSDKALSLSEKGLAFIVRHESFRSTAYSNQNKWYIGYGTPCDETAYPNGITEQTAEKLLQETLLPHSKTVNQFAKQNQIVLTQAQFDALVSFTYSVGSTWADTDSRMSAYLKDGLDQQTQRNVVDAMAVWSHLDKQVNEPYLQRRIDEARLMLYGDYSSQNSPEYYALILDANGGTLEQDIICYAAGTAYDSLPAISRTGYQFDGWYKKDGQTLSSSATATQHITLTAKWTPVSTTTGSKVLAATSFNFKDVKKTDWFYSNVYDLTQSGVINGLTPTTFGPYNTLTYGEALKLILLATSYGEQKPTGSHWASGYLSFAVKNGFLSSSSIKLDAPINRLDIARLAAKAMKLPEVGILSPFADTTDASVLSLYNAGILQGSKENNVLVYQPNSNINRAEISAIIWRIDQYEKETPTTPTPDPVPEPDPKPEPDPEPTDKIKFQNKWIDVYPNVPKSPYDQSLFYKTNGFAYYRSDDYRYETGVDVSVFQGDIDWQKVKDSGIDFAIIRVGGRGYGSEGKIYDDKKFEQNIKGAQEAGMKIGIYFFSQAITVEEAIEEARYTLDKIKGYDVTYPVAFDWESVGDKTARTSSLDANTLSAAANAFCQEIENAGYHPMVYFNLTDGYLRYDLSKIVKYDFWFAQYNAVPTFYYNFDIWQYNDKGRVPGIVGDVDLNLYFHKK